MRYVAQLLSLTRVTENVQLLIVDEEFQWVSFINEHSNILKHVLHNCVRES